MYVKEDGSAIHDIIRNLRLVNDSSYSYVDVHIANLPNVAAANK